MNRILWALALTAIGVGAAAWRGVERAERARVEKARRQAVQICALARQYQRESGRLPPAGAEGLQSILEHFEPGLLARVRGAADDPWGRPYLLEVTVQGGAVHCRTLSYGADRRESGAGYGEDIVASVTWDPGSGK